MNVPPPQSYSQAIHDVIAERQRQIAKEGFDLAHDDAHAEGELAMAGAAYAVNPTTPDRVKLHWWDTPPWWPWARRWWKPKSSREDYVRAAALIIAEIEKIDRRSVGPRLVR